MKQTVDRLYEYLKTKTNHNKKMVLEEMKKITEEVSIESGLALLAIIERYEEYKDGLSDILDRFKQERRKSEFQNADQKGICEQSTLYAVVVKDGIRKEISAVYEDKGFANKVVELARSLEKRVQFSVEPIVQVKVLDEEAFLNHVKQTILKK
ncbi:hypothetical protein [Lihuaxuella thermophila]|uniref:Uncharacterized protein n=1 Tax=Lihuaxuella thermophila TaxID=1173111 RepID=A0A1H8GUJ4_9BACL|nr:hypothetical protein [Lihuaxuella thermophila]SEN47722.1 hypothetical protein SAMN05444955_11283 [Lihuaxuella thermophila]